MTIVPFPKPFSHTEHIAAASEFRRRVLNDLRALPDETFRRAYLALADDFASNDNVWHLRFITRLYDLQRSERPEFMRADIPWFR